MRIGIIGTGSISGRHVDAFRKIPEVEIVAACSTTPAHVEAFAAKHHIPSAYADYRDLVTSANVDAVCVTTWNVSHAPLAIAALRNGKHVLCEKPMAVSAASAQGMLDASRESGRLLMMAMCKRFRERTTALRAFVTGGDLGEIYYAKAGFIRRWGNPGGWFSDRSKSGGGPVIDLGVHLLDLCRYVTGGPRATAVSASVFHRLGMRPEVRGAQKYRSLDYSDYNDVEDGAAALIRFENGLAVAFEASWVQNIKEERQYLELSGTEGGASLSPELEVYETRHGYLADVTPRIDDSEQLAFDRQARHFFECVTLGIPCESPAEDGVHVMQIIDAIYESGRLGREVLIG